MKYIFSLFCIVLLTCCQNTSVQEDAKRYCNCMEDSEKDLKECAAIIDELTMKYEFDPVAADELSKYLSDCMNEEN